MSSLTSGLLFFLDRGISLPYSTFMDSTDRSDLWTPSITLEEAYEIQAILEDRHEDAKRRKDFNTMALLRGEMDRLAREHGL